MKKNVFLAFLLMLVLLFFSCSNDVESSMTDMIEEKTSFRVVSKNGNFQPLNYIPEDIICKMDAGELVIWKKVSNYFYVDYNIINTTYYKGNKKTFLHDMEKLCEEVKSKSKQKSPQKLIVAFDNSAIDAEFRLFELDDTTSGTDPIIPNTGLGSDSTYVEDMPINDNGSFCCRILAPFVNANVYICVSVELYIKGTVQNPIFEIRNQRIFTDPSNAHFSGYVEVTPASQGVNLDAVGRLSYRSAFANINEHCYFKITPKS